METEAHTSWVHFPKITLLVNDSPEAKLGSDSCAGDLASTRAAPPQMHTDGRKQAGNKNGSDGKKIRASVCQNKLQNIYFFDEILK